MIRPAQPDEAGPLARLHVAVWRTTYAGIAPEVAMVRLNEAHREPQWQGYLSDRETGVLVVEGEEELAGLICFGPAKNPVFGAAGEIRHLYVAGTAKGKGHGQSLMAAAFDSLHSRGYPSAALAVVRQNAPALAFYAALKGRQTGQYLDPGPLWRSENLVYSWDLPVSAS